MPNNHFEWSQFSVSNPLNKRSADIEETLADRYILWTPRSTVKVRGEILKYKVVLNRAYDGVESFNVELFNNNPSQDPLEAFLVTHCLKEKYTEAGVILIKRRRIYYLANDIRLYYMNFTFGSQQDTNLTITGRTTQSILEVKADLGIIGSNLNFGAYLTTVCGQY